MDEVNDYNNNLRLKPLESSKSLTVAEFRKTLWKSYVLNKKYKPSTHYSYENLLDHYVEPVIGSSRLKYLYGGPQNQDKIPATFKVDFAPFILVVISHCSFSIQSPKWTSAGVRYSNA